jgi:hypothetical protein
MIRISDEHQLLSAFRESEQAEVHIPADFTFPLALKDYIAWVEPSGHRVYLVFRETQSGNPLGVVFQRTRGSADTAASMCQWCHSVRPGSSVGLLTTGAGPNRRVGLHLCANLDCKENAMKPPGVNDFPEAVKGRDKIERIVRRMNDFAKHNLF